jgi:hypothetical protein
MVVCSGKNYRLLPFYVTIYNDSDADMDADIG